MSDKPISGLDVGTPTLNTYLPGIIEDPTSETGWKNIRFSLADLGLGQPPQPGGDVDTLLINYHTTSNLSGNFDNPASSSPWQAAQLLVSADADFQNGRIFLLSPTSWYQISIAASFKSVDSSGSDYNVTWPYGNSSVKLAVIGEYHAFIPNDATFVAPRYEMNDFYNSSKADPSTLVHTIYAIRTTPNGVTDPGLDISTYIRSMLNLNGSKYFAGQIAVSVRKIS